MTKNPIILNSFNAWHESHSIIGLNITLIRKTPFWNNPRIPYPGSDETLRRWISSGIETVDDLYFNDVFANFQQLCRQFSLPNHFLFKYFQIRNWVRSSSADFPHIPPESPFEKHLRLCFTAKGLTSSIYDIMINNLPIYNAMPVKQKWEADLGCIYDDIDWHNMLECSQTFLISTDKCSLTFLIELIIPHIDYIQYSIMIPPTARDAKSLMEIYFICCGVVRA